MNQINQVSKKIKKFKLGADYFDSFFLFFSN